MKMKQTTITTPGGEFTWWHNPQWDIFSIEEYKKLGYKIGSVMVNKTKYRKTLIK